MIVAGGGGAGMLFTTSVTLLNAAFILSGLSLRTMIITFNTIKKNCRVVKYTLSLV